MQLKGGSIDILCCGTLPKYVKITLYDKSLTLAPERPSSPLSPACPDTPYQISILN